MIVIVVLFSGIIIWCSICQVLVWLSWVVLMQLLGVFLNVWYIMKMFQLEIIEGSISVVQVLSRLSWCISMNSGSVSSIVGQIIWKSRNLVSCWCLWYLSLMMVKVMYIDVMSIEIVIVRFMKIELSSVCRNGWFSCCVLLKRKWKLFRFSLLLNSGVVQMDVVGFSEVIIIYVQGQSQFKVSVYMIVVMSQLFGDLFLYRFFMKF